MAISVSQYIYYNNFEYIDCTDKNNQGCLYLLYLHQLFKNNGIKINTKPIEEFTDCSKTVEGTVIGL